MSKYIPPRSKHALSLTAATFALAGFAATCGHAQQAGNDQATPSAEPELIVTGQRAANKSAIQAKRDAAQVMDSITAQDIGHIADFSVGDALKRIAGVSVYNYQGEPRFATIRGFNAHYLTTTLDGIQVASPDSQSQTNGGGRQFYLEVLPSNIAKRIEVLKTNTPDMDGHSVGGSINFAIPSAFDFKTDRLHLSARAGSQVLEKTYGGSRPTGQAEVFFTRRLGAQKQFGVMLNASIWRRDQWIPQTETGSSKYWYLANGRNSGAPYTGAGPVPTERRWYNYDNSRERQSVLGKLDWRPSDDFSASWTTYGFSQHESAWRNDTIATIGANATVSNQTDATGTLSPRPTAPADVSQNVRLFKLYFDRKIYGTQVAINANLTPKLQSEVKLGYSHTTLSNPQISDYFIQNGLAFNYQLNDDGVLYTPVNPTAYNDLTKYTGGNTASAPQHYIERIKAQSNLFQGKARIFSNMGAADRGYGFELGSSFVRNDHRESYSQTYQFGMPYTLADVISSKRLCSFNCNGEGMFIIDDNKLQAMLDKYLPSVPTQVNTSAPYARAFTIREDVTSLYGMGRWKSDRFTLIAGGRFEGTDFTTTGFSTNTTKAGTVTTVAYKPVEAGAAYGHFLPSVNTFYDLNPQMRVRLAYSRTIGRAKFTDMSLLGGSLDLSDLNNPLLKTGNPELKPRQADNFDLSYEWYLDQKEGLLSIALFSKSIKDEIFTRGTPADIDIGGGITRAGTKTAPVNATDTATVKGIEFNFIKTFDFLPGYLSNLGINANGIFTETKFPVTLADGTKQTLDSLSGQANDVYNVALFYEDGPFQARLALNHIGAFIEDRYMGNGTTSAANFYRIIYTRPADSFDASFVYDVSKTYTVRLDINNITGEGSDKNTGLDQEITTVRMKLPTAIMFGISARY